MASISRQIGWSQESNLLYQILNQLTRLTSVLFSLKPNYKVYTALLTQSGGSNSYEISSGSLTIGVTYVLGHTIIGDDFRNVGGPLITYNDEFNGIAFVATNTIPTNWSGGTFLSLNTGAPVVTVLENTIGNIWFTYDGVGAYGVNSNALFTENKTYLYIQAFLYGPDEDRRIGISNADVNTIQIVTTKATILEDGNLYNTSLEIRVYN